ncbi:hypothetical protein AGMMS50276_10760 [Synergistales bacterium]|nr:hypothetical protein AGMMS50276_10760 [Synergistales bacterium]
MTELKEKYKAALIFAAGMVCFLIAGLIVSAIPRVADRTPVTENKILTEPQAEIQEQTQESPKELPAEWFLYITGHVRKPGVYKLPENSRLFHLVEAAGGLTGYADPNAINLAALLSDGSHVYIPKKGEKKEREDTLASQLQNGQTTIVVDAFPRSPSKKQSDISGPIDVNRATAEELTVLKGIGPSLAKRIVEYRRDHGRFGRVEDLLKVSGIGVKKLDGFRNNVVIRP